MALAAAVQERIERTDWTTTDELLAQLIELVSIVRIEAWLIAGVPRHKLPDPHRVPRPGEAPKEPQVVSPAEFAKLTVVH